MSEKLTLDYLKSQPGFVPNNPVYYDDPTLDQLMSIVLNLGAEIWVLRDRQAQLEELLSKAGDLDVEMLDKGRPSEALAARLKDEREEFIQRLYGKLFAIYGGDKVKPKSIMI